MSLSMDHSPPPRHTSSSVRQTILCIFRTGCVVVCLSVWTTVLLLVTLHQVSDKLFFVFSGRVVLLYVSQYGPQSSSSSHFIKCPTNYSLYFQDGLCCCMSLSMDHSPPPRHTSSSVRQTIL